MYDPYVIFDVFRDHWLPIFGCLAIAMIGNTLFFLEGIRLGFRDRTYASSAICTLMFFAHDLHFVLEFHKWFFEYGYWVWMALWVNILISLIGECVFFYQMVRYAPQELLPGYSRRVLIAALVLAQLGVLIAFSYLKTLLGDPLYLLTIPFTIFWLAPFAIGLTLRRQSRRGQSVALNLSYIMMVVGLWPAWWMLGIPFFQSPLFILLGAVTVLWSLCNCWVLLRFPPVASKRGIGSTVPSA